MSAMHTIGDMCLCGAAGMAPGTAVDETVGELLTAGVFDNDKSIAEPKT